MNGQSAVHDTFVIERNYAAPPERLFRAFADPAAKRRWFAEGGEYAVEEFEMDFRAGGHERVRYRFGEGSPFPGATLAADGFYLDIVPGRRVVLASAMSLGGRRISASLVTIEIVPAETGAGLVLTHQGAFFEGADGPRLREAGWSKLLERLARALAG